MTCTGTSLAFSGPWRFEPLQVADGHTQMQRDLALLAAHQRGELAGAVRFYQWQPAAISLGYHQYHWPEHWAQLTYRGQPLHLVRRPSGGSAVLHQGDLCYAVVIGVPPGTYRQQIQRLQNWLIQGWRELGISLQPGTEKPQPGVAHCFAQAAITDLVTPAGHKFIGSAQLRRGRSLLQHGSIQLHPDPELWRRVFGTEPPPPVATPPLPELVAHFTALARTELAAP
ncbi:MAG: biotin/lipoate A/B protein ligase family protein [Gloeomargarita sp. SKYBB_i_bin120]|nr:lipoate--protein ligase family protein [Gloeomargarita sp. SKYG98]MCS7292073.1 lipoate--protein ligase family protein [Gloeomargarita sp. SKYB120]MDW8177633.1 biotin/lipoate A/B protein ligase family protein [Gloeomargarita sp. SKYBB_i_bin120]